MDTVTTIGWILVVSGFVLAGVEMCVPGFGLPGISGAICLIAGVLMTSKTIEQGILHTIIVVVVLAVMMTIVMLIIHLPRKSSPIVLNDEMPNMSEYIDDDDLGCLIDKEGMAMTDLRPFGKGMFDGVELAVRVYDGKYIQHGSRIKIIGQKDNTLLVKII